MHNTHGTCWFVVCMLFSCVCMCQLSSSRKFAFLDQILCGQMNVAQTCAWLICMDSCVVAVSCLMLLLQCCSCCFATLVQPGCFASLLFVCTVHLCLFAELLALPACMSEQLFAVLPVCIFLCHGFIISKRPRTSISQIGHERTSYQRKQMWRSAIAGMVTYHRLLNAKVQPHG